MRIILLLIDIILINLGFLSSFLLRYGLPVPDRIFRPYKSSFIFLTLIYIAALSFFRVYKSRFKSSWDLLKRVLMGLFFGTLLSIAFVYAFRINWGAFPTGIFILSFSINLLLIFKLNQYVLKAGKKIKKKVLVIGKDNIDDIVGRKAVVEIIGSDEIAEFAKYKDVDEVVISERIQNDKELNLLIFLVQKLKIDVVFNPSIYMELLSGRIKGDNSVHFLSTFVGEKSDVEEFLMRCLDIVGSILMLLVSMPVTIVISLLIKISSSGRRQALYPVQIQNNG
jgi:FlaA1/EpsC-like NDP-sugar epimerase